MMVLTAKVDLKKILIILAAAALGILALIAVLGGSKQTSAPAAGNDARTEYLKNLGWEIALSPVQSAQVRIPEADNEVFRRYNAIQKLQGFDLEPYAGKKVMRYVYKITNYPDATEPVYATVLVYKNNIIGGDITDTAPGGKLMPLGNAPTAPSAPESGS